MEKLLKLIATDETTDDDIAKLKEDLGEEYFIHCDKGGLVTGVIRATVYESGCPIEQMIVTLMKIGMSYETAHAILDGKKRYLNEGGKEFLVNDDWKPPVIDVTVEEVQAFIKWINDIKIDNESEFAFEIVGYKMVAVLLGQLLISNERVAMKEYEFAHDIINDRLNSIESSNGEGNSSDYLIKKFLKNNKKWFSD